VVLIVRGDPICPADVAKLITTEAFHMIAAFEFVDHHFAAVTLSIVKVLLEELKLELIAFALVEGEEAFRTELRAAL
jgi:hypothetical protein